MQRFQSRVEETEQRGHDGVEICRLACGDREFVALDLSFHGLNVCFRYVDHFFIVMDFAAVATDFRPPAATNCFYRLGQQKRVYRATMLPDAVDAGIAKRNEIDALPLVIDLAQLLTDDLCRSVYGRERRGLLP